MRAIPSAAPAIGDGVDRALVLLLEGTGRPEDDTEETGEILLLTMLVNDEEKEETGRDETGALFPTIIISRHCEGLDDEEEDRPMAPILTELMELGGGGQLLPAPDEEDVEDEDMGPDISCSPT